MTVHAKRDHKSAKIFFELALDYDALGTSVANLERILAIVAEI